VRWWLLAGLALVASSSSQIGGPCGAGLLERQSCRWAPSPPRFPGPQCCCAVEAPLQTPRGTLERGLYCLPSLVIVGAQKSGTTALAVELMKHSQVLFSKLKETHYFDHRAPQGATLESYLAMFPPMPCSVGATELWCDASSHITAEATPSYMLWRLAVPGLVLVNPHVQVIVALREPVSRLYSEWHMKHRRLEAQEEWLEAGALHALSAGIDCCSLWLGESELRAAESSALPNVSSLSFLPLEGRDEYCATAFRVAGHIEPDGMACFQRVLRVVSEASSFFRLGTEPVKLSRERVAECIEAQADSVAMSPGALMQEWAIEVNGLRGHRCLATDLVSLESHLTFLASVQVGLAQAARCIVPCDKNVMNHASPGWGASEWHTAQRDGRKWRSSAGQWAVQQSRKGGSLTRSMLVDGDLNPVAAPDSAMASVLSTVEAFGNLSGKVSHDGESASERWDSATRAALAGNRVANTTMILRGRPSLLSMDVVKHGAPLMMRGRGALSAVTSSGIPSASHPPLPQSWRSPTRHECISSPAWGSALRSMNASSFLPAQTRAAIEARDAPSLSFQWGASAWCWPYGSGMNIAVDIVPRSIYVEQLRELLQWLPPTAIHVVSQDDLTQHFNRTVRQLFGRVGLAQEEPGGECSSLAQEWAVHRDNRPNTTTVEVHGSDMIRSLTAAGWRSRGEYAPLDEGLFGELASFFKPFNQGLDRLLADQGLRVCA
jgi:hypothetical protein